MKRELNAIEDISLRSISLSRGVDKLRIMLRKKDHQDPN